MLTRIEIDGFKSFRSFAFDFRPFQVFIGPNGVGKTNLFDAIALLAALAGENTLEMAFHQNRGELPELFTMYADHTRATRMTLAAEMLIGKTAADAQGRPVQMASTRLRYEISIERKTDGGRERVHVVSESLLPIKESDDKWVRDNLPPKNRKTWALRDKRPPYIATVGEGEQVSIYRNQDTLAGGREGTKVGNIERTILSASDATRYPTINAVRQEMQSWRFLQLNPAVLRAPAAPHGVSTLLPDGSNLAVVLARLARDHAAALKAVTKDMTAMIPNVRGISVKPLPERDELLIELETQDGARFSSRVLSDGTLRLLALITLKNDPTHRGVLCFEEPENGVQPQRLKQIVDVLYALSTDLERAPDSDRLRQVLINTHSPGLIANVPAESLFYVGMKAAENGRQTYTVPVRPELIPDEQQRYLTWEQVTQKLESIQREME